MSYNIDNVKATFADAYMLAKDITRLCRDHDDTMPGCAFIYSLRHKALASLEEGLPSGKIALCSLSWCGVGSGYSYRDVLIEHVVPLIHGRVEAIFTWEGGDSTSGLIIQDGVATECDVVQTLVPKKIP